MSQTLGDFASGPADQPSAYSRAASVEYAQSDWDARTIASAIAGDQDALREVWQAHRRWTAAVLLAHMPRDADLDDLLQEVGMTVVAKINGVREPGAFKPWLRAVAMSVAKTAGRRRQVRKAGFLKLVNFRGGDADDQRHGGDGPARNAALAEGRLLMELSAQLPEGYREPLLLKCVQGMSYREIGRVMGIPETTVETRIARARKMLRQRAVQAGLGQDGHQNENDAALATARAASDGRLS